jgi:hypothetical protein
MEKDAAMSKTLPTLNEYLPPEWNAGRFIFNTRSSTGGVLQTRRGSKIHFKLPPPHPHSNLFLHHQTEPVGQL